MLKAAIFLLGFGLLVSSLNAATQEIQINNMSLRMKPSTAKIFNNVYKLEFTSAGPGDASNGELRLGDDSSPYSHLAILLLADPITFETYPLAASIDVPYTDSNNNNLPDILEYSGSVTGLRRDGVYSDPDGDHSIVATWSKAANSNTGVCKLELPELGLTFNPAFEIQNYSGVFSYAREGSFLNGTIQATRNGAAANSLEGPLSLEIKSTATWEWASGIWKDETAGEIHFSSAQFLKQNGPTYESFAIAEDGDPSTTISDYTDWVIRLPDFPDANGNGIPDVVENVTLPPPPTLRLFLDATGLKLTISGGKGRLFELQQTSSLDPVIAWNKLDAISPATDELTIALETPANAPSFWRLKE